MQLDKKHTVEKQSQKLIEEQIQSLKEKKFKQIPGIFTTPESTRIDSNSVKELEKQENLFRQLKKKQTPKSNMLKQFKPVTTMIINDPPKQSVALTQQQKQAALRNARFSHKQWQNNLKKDLRKDGLLQTPQKLAAKQQAETALKPEDCKGEVKESIELKKDEKDKKQDKSYTLAAICKKKHINKGNFVRLDLKRKYKDRFVGKLYNNIRNTRNGRRKIKAPEIVVEDGQIYNPFASSLSKALLVDLCIDSDSQRNDLHLDSPKVNEVAIPCVYSKQNLTKYLKEVFGFDDFREGQYQTLQLLLNRKSTLFISQTASGKSLTYIMGSMLLRGLSLVVSPLVSLMLDQLSHMPDNFPAACISSLIDRQQRANIVQMVQNGSINLLFLTPQSLQTDFIYQLKNFPPVNFVCVDQAHSLSELSHNFRTSFLSLGDILLNFVKYIHHQPVILALTATANTQTVSSIVEKLQIKQVIRSNRSVSKNLQITVSRQRGTAKFDAIIKYITHPIIRKCQGILIYTRARFLMEKVFNYIKNSVEWKIALYHGGLSNKQKTQTLQKFRDGKYKVVIATVALGMGLDFENLDCVIHLNMPKSIQNYVQQMGRAGRRNRRGYCHLFLDREDYFTQRNYIIADQIEKPTLELIYETLKLHSDTNHIQQQQQGLTKQEPVISQQRSEQDILRQNKHLRVKRKSLIDKQKKKLKEKQIAVIQEDQEQEYYESQQSQVTARGLATSKAKKQESIFTDLFYCRVAKLIQFTGLTEESILTLFFKIQKTLKQSPIHFKVLPLTHETVKIGFFKQNQNQIRQESQLFCDLMDGSKSVRGTTYINLIKKCNTLKRKPVDILAEIYELGEKYTLKIQLETPIFIWRFSKNKETANHTSNFALDGYIILKGQDNQEKVIKQMNESQGVTLTKLNILYTLAEQRACDFIDRVLKQRLLPPSKPLPAHSITNDLDQYFRTTYSEFYDKITSNKTEIYIPTEYVQVTQYQDIYGCIILFFKHQINDNEDNITAKECLMQKYLDGKKVTRVLMGINSSQANYKIYGGRPYWRKYVRKNYNELLVVVQDCIDRYKRQYWLIEEEQKKQRYQRYAKEKKEQQATPQYLNREQIRQNEADQAEAAQKQDYQQLQKAEQQEGGGESLLGDRQSQGSDQYYPFKEQ